MFLFIYLFLYKHMKSDSFMLRNLRFWRCIMLNFSRYQITGTGKI